MTRWLVLLAVLAVLGFVALIIWPRDSNETVTAGTNPPPAAEGEPASFTVLVSGEEVRPPAPGQQLRMADTPISQVSPSMVSQVRSIGNTRILVFADGSELIVDRFILEQLPPEIAYRAGYVRGE